VLSPVRPPAQPARGGGPGPGRAAAGRRRQHQHLQRGRQLPDVPQPSALRGRWVQEQRPRATPRTLPANGPTRN